MKKQRILCGKLAIRQLFYIFAKNYIEKHKLNVKLKQRWRRKQATRWVNYLEMIITPKKRLSDFAVKHPVCGKQLKILINDLKKGFFENPNQLKDSFPYVSLLRNNRVVFNVHGNKYRLVLQINYGAQAAFVRFIGTHAEYDKIDANKVK